MGIFSAIFSKSNDNELMAAIKEGCFLVDVRSQEEFLSGSIKDAVNIPLDKISGQLSQFSGRKNIIVFCLSGNRSNQALGMLKQAGFGNVLNGGSIQNLYRAIHGK